MNFKKATALVLSLASIGSFTSLSAFAEEDTAKATYDYVAIGDSISAGYGLEADDFLGDRSMLLSEELIADPIKGAYPAVFGTYLAEAGEKYGYQTTAVNLSAPAYRAVDLKNVILEEGSRAPFGVSYFERFVGEGTSELLLPYHDIYNKYIPEAELISVQLGGNDIIMGALTALASTQNPILKGIHTAFSMMLFGKDFDTAIAMAKATIANSGQEIDYQTILEAFQFFSGSGEATGNLVDISAENVKELIETVQSENSTAEIALINMYNPYITEYKYADAFARVIKETFKEAIQEATDIEQPESGNDEIEIEISDSDELIENDEEFEEASSEVDKDVEKLKSLINKLNEKNKVVFNSLLEKITNEIAYPYVYTLMGKGSGVVMESLNKKLLEVSEETGSHYVDIYYAVTPEANSDPHPTAEGHKQIADVLWSDMQSYVMDAIRPAPTFEKQSLILGGEIGVNFYMDLSNLTDEEKQDSYVEFTVGDETTIDTFDENAKNQTKKYYGFTCRIPSVGMADDITAVFHYGNDKTVTKVYTAEEYLELFDESDPENLLNLIRSINDYGYHAQQYLSKNATTPWTIGVEHQPMKKVFKDSYSGDEVNEIMTAIEDKKISKDLSGDIENVNYSLTLDADTAINLFIKQSDNYDGSMLVFVDKVLVFPKRQSDGRYRLTISGISPQHLGDMHEITILTKKGVSKVNVSALSYVYDCLESPLNVEETNAMASVYNYYASTMAYINS